MCSFLAQKTREKTQTGLPSIEMQPQRRAEVQQEGCIPYVFQNVLPPSKNMPPLQYFQKIGFSYVLTIYNISAAAVLESFGITNMWEKTVFQQASMIYFLKNGLIVEQMW